MKQESYFYSLLQHEEKYALIYSGIAMVAPFALFILFLFWAYMTPVLSNDALAISLAVLLPYMVDILAS
jgi:hypothetical protein